MPNSCALSNLPIPCCREGLASSLQEKINSFKRDTQESETKDLAFRTLYLLMCADNSIGTEKKRKKYLSLVTYLVSPVKCHMSPDK